MQFATLQLSLTAPRGGRAAPSPAPLATEDGLTLRLEPIAAAISTENP